MSDGRLSIYDVVDNLKPGNLALVGVRPENWGSTIHFDLMYRYPPVTKSLTITFHDCRGIEWNVQKSGGDIASDAEAQLISHDLGQPDYRRTARIAATLVEIILSYRRYTIDID